ncbi:hypothetical protein DFH07DRAFT_821307 [Mycena maculata]|uniref:Uncharacterized protein n=1 Tax=Mycena maculata TaxID=230809 RepID=A0AAD7J408_9AGAR|nr:hypothetical protein DFH07DRAFT_821307 [Mycena maculata]
MGGSSLIQVYNECDVIKLALRLGKPLPEDIPIAGERSPSESFARKNGPRIMRTTAIKKFNLKASQMDQLKPVSATPNAYGTLTRYYNRCDVENLKLRLDELRAAPAPAAAPWEF